MVKRKAAKYLFLRSLRSVANWCRELRHSSITELWSALTEKLRGHFSSYGVAGNHASQGRFRYHVRSTWRGWLFRRSQRDRIAWEQFAELERRYPLAPAGLRVVRLVT